MGASTRAPQPEPPTQAAGTGRCATAAPPNKARACHWQHRREQATVQDRSGQATTDPQAARSGNAACATEWHAPGWLGH
jgi:hypothetical protein